MLGPVPEEGVPPLSLTQSPSSPETCVHPSFVSKLSAYGKDSHGVGAAVVNVVVVLYAEFVPSEHLLLT